MKKIIVLAIFFSLIPFAVFATSGACSSHGGANCSAGADSTTGNAVCNDGWVSSVSFSEMDECQSHCTVPKTTGCTQSLIDSYQNSYNQCVQQETQLAQKLADSLAMNCARGGGVGCTSNPTPDLSSCDIYPLKVASCKKQIEDSNTEMQLYVQCEKNYEDSLDRQFQLKENSLCVSTYGSHSHYDSISSTGCACQSGYILDSYSECTLQQQVKQDNCFNKYGPGGQYNSSSDTCACIDGDIIDINGQCVRAKLLDVSSETVTPASTPAKKSKFLEGVTIGQPAKPQTKGIDFSKFTTKPPAGSVIVKPSVAPLVATPKKSMMGEVWNFIKGLFGK